MPATRRYVSPRLLSTGPENRRRRRRRRDPRRQAELKVSSVTNGESREAEVSERHAMVRQSRSGTLELAEPDPTPCPIIGSSGCQCQRYVTGNETAIDGDVPRANRDIPAISFN